MLSRREFLLSGAAGIGFVPSAQAQNNKARATATVTRTAGRLSLGLNGPTYYSGFCPFLNWQNVASAVQISRKVGGDLSGRSVFDAGIYLDPETGELVSPAPDDLLTISSLFYASPGEGNLAGGYDFSGMEWTIKWDGAARCTINGLTKGGTQAINNDARLAAAPLPPQQCLDGTMCRRKGVPDPALLSISHPAGAHCPTSQRRHPNSASAFCLFAGGQSRSRQTVCRV